MGWTLLTVAIFWFCLGFVVGKVTERDRNHARAAEMADQLAEARRALEQIRASMARVRPAVGQIKKLLQLP